MTVSFMWEIVKPAKSKSFRNGMSSDIDPLKETFGEFLTADNVPMLRAMHLATGRDGSLWKEIADVLERLQGDQPGNEVTIRIWHEF